MLLEKEYDLLRSKIDRKIFSLWLKFFQSGMAEPYGPWGGLTTPNSQTIYLFILFYFIFKIWPLRPQGGQNHPIAAVWGGPPTV
jgi:hypothetical protein